MSIYPASELWNTVAWRPKPKPLGRNGELNKLERHADNSFRNSDCRMLTNPMVQVDVCSLGRIPCIAEDSHSTAMHGSD